jgi:hypothetical protein
MTQLFSCVAAQLPELLSSAGAALSGACFFAPFARARDRYMLCRKLPAWRDMP